ncbi:unnamed protein product [Cuscuta europaea]|uniref:Uncharacterized protein n=1 Tax=Cuscuta europaea TaxID=41803 RepID=A0A9P0Z7W8_CUSEU|nr:unnamed protein product [Cuscuta europaea]
MLSSSPYRSEEGDLAGDLAGEAEYIAATGGACQGIWLTKLLNNLNEEAKSKPLLKVDNKSAIALANNHVHHERNKHIDTRFHFIRECIEKGAIKLQHVRTGDQLADILTKPLGRQRFSELRSKIGVQFITEGNKFKG